MKLPAIKLTAKQKAKVEELLGEAKELRDDFKAGADELQRCRATYDSLNARIAKAESSVDPADELSVSKLTTYEKQRSLCATKIQELTQQTQPAAREVQFFLHDRGNTFGQCLKGTYDEIELEVAKALKPFCHNDGDALMRARQLPAVQGFSLFMTRQCCWGGYESAAFHELARLIECCEALLRGEVLWSFPPKAEPEVEAAVLEEEASPEPPKAPSLQERYGTKVGDDIERRMAAGLDLEMATEAALSQHGRTKRSRVR